MNTKQLGRIESLLHLAAAWIDHEPQLVADHLREHMKGQVRAAIADVEQAKIEAAAVTAIATAANSSRNGSQK